MTDNTLLIVILAIAIVWYLTRQRGQHNRSIAYPVGVPMPYSTTPAWGGWRGGNHGGQHHGGHHP